MSTVGFDAVNKCGGLFLHVEKLLIQGTETK